MAAVNESSLIAILNSIPEKSRESYNKAWNDFQHYRNTVLETTGVPNLDDYISFFTHLRNVLIHGCTKVDFRIGLLCLKY